MKNHKTIVLLLIVPLALFAQSNPTSSNTSVDLASSVASEDEVLNVEASEIPSVDMGVLSDEAEVVMDLPGQGADSSEASINEEETISVDFPDEDVRTILRSVADLYDLNLVIPDGLQGRTSIKLRNITWDQVFEVVLDPLGYTFIEDRNIIRVKSIEELTAEPADTRIFIINYARAEELKISVESLVDPAAGGNIQVDVRSNALVIKERPSLMGKIEEVIESLDKPTEQVMIESKFIEVSDSDIEQIGINWSSLGGDEPFTLSTELGRDITSQRDSSYLTNYTSNNTDVDFLTSQQGLAGQVVGASGPLLPSPSNQAELDAGTASTPIYEGFGGTSLITDAVDDLTTKIDTAVFSASRFDVILTALETKNDIKLVSNPTVVALNNTSAKIAIGERYPLPEYAFNAQTGERQLTGFEYIDIGVNLDVVPSVNDAGFINLDIIPEVSSIGEAVIIEGTEIPRINSRRTETNITIKDGYTLAIGGLSSEDTNNRATKVPLLGDLPGIGRFFRSKNNNTISRNLIIFITAKTLDPDGSTYRDVVDPRTINDMQLVPSDLPGYEVSSEDLKILKEMEELRIESRHEDEIEAIQNEIDLIKEAKEKERLKEEKKSPKE